LALGGVFVGIVAILRPTAERQDMLEHVTAMFSDLAAVIAGAPVEDPDQDDQVLQPGTSPEGLDPPVEHRYPPTTSENAA
jgi:hypothetical protein